MKKRQYDSPVPNGVLNQGVRKEHMEAYDKVFPKPQDWLRANACRFYFTYEQIVTAANDDYESVDNCPGIYFLVRNCEIVYVGLSVQISSRIAKHRVTKGGWDLHAWFEAPPDHLKAIESYYIHRFTPILNGYYPPKSRFGEFVEELVGPEQKLDVIRKESQKQQRLLESIAKRI